MGDELRGLLDTWSLGTVLAPVGALKRPFTTNSRVISVEKAKFHARNLSKGLWKPGETMIAVHGHEQITPERLEKLPAQWGLKWDGILSKCEKKTDVWDQNTFLIVVDAQHRTFGVQNVFDWFSDTDPYDDEFYPVANVIVLKHDTPIVVRVRFFITKALM